MLSVNAIMASIQTQQASFENTKVERGYGNLVVGGDDGVIVSNYTDDTAIILGDGDDYVLSAGTGCYINTQGGDDKIVGIGNLANIHAGKGNDKIYWQGDRIQTYLEEGDDYLAYEGNHNFIRGGAGNDSIYSASLGLYVRNGVLTFEGLTFNPFSEQSTMKYVGELLSNQSNSNNVEESEQQDQNVTDETQDDANCGC